MIPQHASKEDQIRAAIAEVGLMMPPPVCYPPGDEHIPEKSRVKHPDKHFYRFDAPIVESKKRNELQKLLGGMVVCAEGVLVKMTILPDANGAGEPEKEERVEPPTPVAAPELGAEGPGREASSQSGPEAALTLTDILVEKSKPQLDALHTKAVKDAEPARPRFEVKTVIQTFRVNQPEIAQMVNDQYEHYLNDGWIEADSVSVLNPVGDSYQFVRVVTFKRTV